MIEDTHLPNSFVFNDFNWIATLGLSYVEEPLVVKSSSGTKVVRPIIDNMMALHTGLGFYPYQWLMFGVTTSFSRFEDSEKGNAHFGITDPELKAKIRFIATDRFALAVLPYVTIPTYSGKLDVSGFGSSSFLSDEGVGVGTKLVGEYLFSFAQLVASVGYRQNNKAVFSTLDYRQRMDTALGAYIPIRRSFGANVEWARLWTFKNSQNANELYAGISFGITRFLHGFGGISTGNFFAKNDGNDYRLTAGIKYVPLVNRAEREPIKVIENEKEYAEFVETAPVAQAEVSCVSRYVLGNTNVATLRFPHSLHSLKAGKLAGLDEVTALIIRRQNDIEKVVITGHTSAVGSSAFNQKLSEHRAAAVKEYMVGRGISDSLVEVKGDGESTLLVSPELTPADQEQNRRTEILIRLRPDVKICT
jgi:outer membrane protein OmpA-like peptidoglycan-associated protein